MFCLIFWKYFLLLGSILIFGRENIMVKFVIVEDCNVVEVEMFYENRVFLGLVY